MPEPNENSGQPTDEPTEVRTCQIVPREGALPFKLGMSREEVRSLLGEPGFSKPRRDFYLQNGLSFEYKEEQVIFIHIARSSGLTVTYQNVDVFQTSANELISIVARDGDYDDTNPEFGQIYDFPKLSVVFWRPVFAQRWTDYPTGDSRRGCADHAALIDALEAGDSERAREVTRRHIQQGGRDALAAYDQRRLADVGSRHETTQ